MRNRQQRNDALIHYPQALSTIHVETCVYNAAVLLRKQRSSVYRVVDTKRIRSQKLSMVPTSLSCTTSPVLFDSYISHWLR